MVAQSLKGGRAVPRTLVVMAGSSSGLRRRRRQYALAARRHALLQGPPFPTAFPLPGRQRLERKSYLFWRVRLPLWAALGCVGWMAVGAVGAVGAVLGFFTAVLVEIAVSYGRPCGPAAVAVPTRLLALVVVLLVIVNPADHGRRSDRGQLLLGAVRVERR